MREHVSKHVVAMAMIARIDLQVEMNDKQVMLDGSTDRACNIECSELERVECSMDVCQGLEEEDTETRGGQIENDGIGNVSVRNEDLFRSVKLPEK